MSLLTNIALGLGGIAAGSAAWGGLTNSYSEYHSGPWDWQYKGAAFKNRVGEFSFYSDNKSRYNDYLKDYGSVIGYKSNLSSSGSYDVMPNNTLVASLDPVNNSQQVSNYGTYSAKVGTQIGENEDNSFVEFVKGAKQLRSVQFSYTSIVKEVSAIEAVQDKEVLMGRANYKSNNKFGVLDSKSYITKLGDPNDNSIKKAGDDYALGKNINHNFIHSKVVQITDETGLEKVRFDSKPLGFGSFEKRALDIVGGDPAWKKSDTYFETSHVGIVSETKQYLEGLKRGQSNVGRDEGNKYLFSDDMLLKEISTDIGNVKQGGNVIIETASFEEGLTTQHPLIKSILNTAKTNEVLIVGGSENKRSMPNYLKTGRITTAKRQIHRNVVIVDQQDETIAYVGNTSRFTDSNIGEVGIRISSKEFPNEVAFLKKQALMGESDPERFLREMQVSNKMRQKGIHNQLMRPLYDEGKDFKGLVISNKKTHSEQFEMARYNASMRATGQFTSIVDVEDMTTFQNILQASKPIGTNLTAEELSIAKAFDFAVNTPSLASRINEYFFIPMGMGRVYKEEKGVIPSLFGAVGGLIDQAFLVNNPALRSYRNDGENYFQTKTSFFQDLLEGSAAGILATASSIGVYLAVGEPLKAMASEAILQTQETLLKAADTNRAAKNMLNGDLNNIVGFKMSLIERNIEQAKNNNVRAFYDVNTPSFSLYYLDNYARHRGASFFAATAQDFLLNKVSPYKLNETGQTRLISAINDYLQVLQSPADIRIIDKVGDVVMDNSKIQQWDTAFITTNSKGTINIPQALAILREKDSKGKYTVTETVANEINEAVNKKYNLKIENVSIERNLQLAKKLQGILNVVPMPWAWGIFTGRTKTDVTGPMIGNLLDIEGFARHVNASIKNQGFWGAANEYMVISKEGTKAANPAFRIVNHLATMTRSVLAFNEQGGKSKADLESIMDLTKTYSTAEKNLDDTLAARGKSDVKTSSAKGYTVFDTTNMADDEVRLMLDNEAHYQAKWKELSGKRVGLGKITLDKELFKYAGQAADGNGLGYALNLLDRGGTYTGMKVASTKLAAAKWIIGALFIPQLVGTEYLQRTGVSLFGTQRGQDLLNKGTTNTVIELQSNNFVSVKEVARGMGFDVNTSNLIGGVESLVSMAGIANWAYNHASTFSPEIHAKMFQGQNVLSQIEGITLPDTLDPKTNTKVPSVYQAVTDIQAQLKKADGTFVDDFLGRVGNNDIAFRTVTENGQVTGLKVLNAKVMKNMTSFTISLGLTLAAMQTARYVVSSAINSERQLMGSAFLSTYLLAVPATILAAAAMVDNTVHTVNAVGGFTGKKVGYNNYYLTGKVATGALYALQGATNMMFKNGVSTLVSLALLGTVTTAGYMFKLTPFQGDINGPKADELNITAMTKLGSYVTHVNKRIEEAKKYGGDAAISERVSPLEVNAALLAVSLGKIMNPILSSQKGSTAYVTAIQSPTPIFQFYSVIKKIEDSSGSSYTTVGLGLQGPPAFGFAPINVSLPIAFAMNKESSNGIALKTGYFGSGIVLNENNKDSLSLHDYAAIYGQVALWSSVGLTVSSTFHNNRSWGRNKQILKSGGTYVPSEPLLIQSMRGGRDKFMGIATLPFSIAMQSMKILAGDLRMPSLRLTSSAFMPLAFNAVAAGVFSQFMVGVFREATLPFKESIDGGKKDTSWNLTAIGLGALGWTGYQYYKGTIAASRQLARLEEALVTGSDKIKFDKTNIDPITRFMYKGKYNQQFRNIHKSFKKGLEGGLFKFVSNTINNNPKASKGVGLVLAGALWNHFITDPKVGMINPEVAYGNLKDDSEDTYSWGARRITTVIGGALTFTLTASLSTFNIKNFVSTIDYEGMIDSYGQRLRTVKALEHKVKRGAGFGAWANLKYQEMKLGQQGWEVQSIYEGDMHKNPMIEFIDEQGNKVKEAIKMKDPTAHLREVAKDRGTAAFTNLQQLDTTAGTSLNNIAKNNDAKSVMSAIRNGYTDLNLPPDKQAKNLSMALKNSAWLGGGNLGIRTKSITSLAVAATGITFLANSANWISNALGYKDFQDAFLTKDDVGNNSIKQGIVDLVKLITRHDRANDYEISKGLVGPNFKTSDGEFLLSPDTTVKGSLSKAMKNLQKLTLFNSPNIFVGAEIGGITIRADDSDARVRDYFQLQSASQDFSSAMYSMSAVFGLQELKKKGFLPNAIVANLRGIDSGEELNQNQLRSYAAAIITAVASQPIRQGKDRIKFTAPDKFTLDAMQTNKALAMSLNQRYKTLRSLSYANSMQLGLFNLMNNMSISDPSMQNKLMKSLMKLNQDDQMGLGEANQNFFMGGKADPKWVALKMKDDNPFNPLKLSIEETNSENAFSESMGIAMQSTINQYIEPKNLLETISSNAGQLVPSSIKSMGQMPTPLLIALGLLGLGGLYLIGSATVFSFSQSQVTKENTALYRQQSKFYDEGDWFSKHDVQAVQLQGSANNAQQLKTSQYLLLKRAGVTFNIAEGLSGRLVTEFTQQINELAGALSFTFDSNYRAFAQNYGALADDYFKGNVQRLNDFYDAQVSTTTTTVNTGITRDQRIARDHARTFEPIMASRLEIYKYEGGTKDQKIIEHLLDDFTNKQLVDAYLEGQYEAYKAQGQAVGAPSDFAKKYYPGFTYDDLLKQEVDKSFIRVTDKTGTVTKEHNLNIFGKDRNINMEYSINRMKEVYATKFDVIIDNYFDVLESRVNSTFAQFPDKNIYTEFIGSDMYDINRPTPQAEIASHLTNRRMEMKQQLRSNISNELTAIFTVRKQGWTAMFDTLLTLVKGGKVENNLARVSLGVANAAQETILEIRSQGGKVFGGRGNMGAAKELEQAALTAAENELKITTKQGVGNSMNAGPTPTSIQGNTAGKGGLEALTGFGSLIMNAFQAAQFASVNLLTLRAAASIASSKTGEREKEMAKEEMAKEGFENVFAGLFWGAVLGNEQFKSFAIPVAVGLVAGYIGYEGVFQKNGYIAGAMGGGLMIGGWALKSVSKQWGLSVGLLGLTLIGRSVFDANTSAIKALSPEVGNFVVEQGDRFQNWGRSGFRLLQDNSAPISALGGAVFGLGGIYNLTKGGNLLINAGILTVGTLLFGSGIAKLTEDKSNVNHKADAASRAGLSVIANMVVSKYSSKLVDAAGNLVVKTMTSRAAEELAKQKALQVSGQQVINAAANTVGKNAVTTATTKAGMASVGKIAMTGAKGLGRLFGSFFAGPWGLGITIGMSIFQLVSILAIPDEVDNLASNISHAPSNWIGQPGHLLLSPSNQIYNDRKYKDVDARNPLFYGTVTDAAKEQWLEQVSTMDDITGRNAAGRNMSSFDAPMTGYSVTSQGYGPKGLDPVEDMAMNIRGKLYTQQVTGRQYRNTKIDESSNREIIQQRMTTAEKLQVQMWERQINSAVDTQNRQIIGKPVTSAKEFRSINNQAMKDIGDVSTKIKLSLNNVEAINKAPNLTLKVEQPKIGLIDPAKQVLFEGNHYTQPANEIRKTTNSEGKTVITFNIAASPNSEVIAKQRYDQAIDYVTINSIT
jgi:hypothetical protein